MQFKETVVIKTVAERILEIQSMWNIKAKVIPVSRAATGTISKSFRKIPEQQTYRESTESRNFGHCAHTQVSTNVKVQNIINLQNKLQIVNTDPLQYYRP